MESNHFLWKVGFLSIIFLFFLQLATFLIGAIYSVNLLGSSLNLYAAGIAWMFSSGLLIFLPLKIKLLRKPELSQNSFLSRLNKFFFQGSYEEPLVYRRISQIFAIFVIIFRLISPWLKTRPTIIFAGLGVAFFFLFYPLYLLQIPKDFHKEEGLAQGISLAIATLLSILFRTIGASLDSSIFGWTQLIGWVLGIICMFGIFNFGKIIEIAPPQEEKVSLPPSSKQQNHRSFLASFCLLNLFILIVFGFESPTVFARWTQGNYIAIVVILVIVILSLVIVSALKPDIISKIPQWGLWAWNIFFTIMLALTIIVHTVSFPSAPDSAVVVVGSPYWYQQIPLYMMLISSPIIFLDMVLFCSQLIHSSPKLSTLTGSFTLHGLYFIILIFMAIFTNVWGYVKPVSNLLRNLYWLPYLIIGLGMIGGVFAINLTQHQFNVISIPKIGKQSIAILSSLVTIGIIISAFLVVPSPASDGNESISSITVMTYNIQEGNNQSAEANYASQLEVIQNSGADIIALQECDTTRIGLWNNDLVRYLATALDYYSYFGPKTVTGTFGTAILSRFPITRAETLFSYSNKDETGTAYATVLINNEEFHIFSSHPDGNADNHREHMNAILEKIEDESLNHVISMGDFNTRQDSEYYNMSLTMLDDTWLRVYPTGVDEFGNNMTRRIDHIFISSEFEVENVWVIPEGPSQSDHNVFWAKLTW
ncbi:hypothetical protein NEF87_003922 [Candidatus Lokiarchaeum ossiferum]|uniref:Endonuclease/exonuclease/phosphatase domain-containing protein n=1 Tax=Candidatus Lokiarchaeum ossiferum TaxID=2951803 RepID=A0ABY6HXP9_9ARCH|nr:hypothetical protein NEF87_003922 [Candidatus Lokiarchaeum sp. B-35]